MSQEYLCSANSHPCTNHRIRVVGEQLELRDQMQSVLTPHLPPSQTGCHLESESFQGCSFEVPIQCFQSFASFQDFLSPPHRIWVSLDDLKIACLANSKVPTVVMLKFQAQSCSPLSTQCTHHALTVFFSCFPKQVVAVSRTHLQPVSALVSCRSHITSWHLKWSPIFE